MAVRRNPNELLLETRKMNRIANNTAKEKPLVAREAAVDLMKRDHPNAVLRSITATYNCAGLVVACRRAHAKTEELKRILDDDGYTLLESHLRAKPGDIVLYLYEGEVEHVGVVATVDPDVLNADYKITVLSKWGDDGEYFHDIADVPEVYGRATEFWTDRKMVQ